METKAEYITTQINHDGVPWLCGACGAELGTVSDGMLTVRSEPVIVAIRGDAWLRCRCGAVRRWEYRRGDLPPFVERMMAVREQPPGR